MHLLTDDFYPLSNLFIIRFYSPVSGPSQCNVCLESNSTDCFKNQQTQVCATNPYSLGTTHCASAVGKYRNSKGNVVEGFFRGCINCAGKVFNSIPFNSIPFCIHTIYQERKYYKYRIYSIKRSGPFLNFWALRVDAYLRWAVIPGWALKKLSPFSASGNFILQRNDKNNKTWRCTKAEF